MTKRDRIAIVVSIGWFIFSILFAYETSNEIWVSVLALMIPVFIYWGYRIIKGS